MELHTKMITLYSMYCEGFINAARIEYNKIAKEEGVSVDQIRKIILHSPFSRQVLSWTEALEKASMLDEVSAQRKQWALDEIDFAKRLDEGKASLKFEQVNENTWKSIRIEG